MQMTCVKYDLHTNVVVEFPKKYMQTNKDS